ncbi:MAG: hypothetical protein EA377_14055 [Phycisphaerales bacterium]|nr:MAG: hypothetical protein EA377_14055 [Phycisphaerales bacterium]
MAGGAVKQCVVCGEDCANKPRVKDPKGRYYCKPCYNRAAAQRREKQRQRELEESRESSPPQDDPGNESTAGGLGLGSLLDDSDASGSGMGVGLADEPTPKSREGTCPECGHGYEAGAVICVNCGYNLRSGKKLQASVIADDGEDDAAEEASPATSRWPTVIGVLAIIVAAFGLLTDLAGTVSVIAVLTDLGAVGAVVLMMYVLGIGFSGWLGVGGVMLVQRRALAATMLRLWAGVYLATHALLFIVTAVLAIAASDTLLAELADEGVDQEVLDFLRSAWSLMVIGFSLFSFLWLAIVPAFLLIWFRRKKIQREVESWDTSESD